MKAEAGTTKGLMYSCYADIRTTVASLEKLLAEKLIGIQKKSRSVDKVE